MKGHMVKCQEDLGAHSFLRLNRRMLTVHNERHHKNWPNKKKQQPRFPWNKGSHFPSKPLTFGGPDLLWGRYNLTAWSMFVVPFKQLPLPYPTPWKDEDSESSSKPFDWHHESILNSEVIFPGCKSKMDVTKHQNKHVVSVTLVCEQPC